MLDSVTNTLSCQVPTEKFAKNLENTNTSSSDETTTLLSLAPLGLFSPTGQIISLAGMPA